MASPDSPHYPIAAITNPGLVRRQNEDRLKVTPFNTPLKQSPAILAVMADGIGGHPAGEVAAQMAVESISRRVPRSLGTDRAKTLANAIRAASREIYSLGLKHPDCLGLGTTIACALVVGNQLFTASVGDSRIYLIRGKRILQLSEDHTWVREMLDRRLITPEQAAGHPNSHVIRRFLGSPQPPEVDLRMRLSLTESDYVSLNNQGTEMQPGDRLLLCTDGLTDLVADNEIRQTIEGVPISQALDALVELANGRGGTDNISIILLAVPAK
jgi:serine/threonine protein phosphatase PrpC